MRTHWCENCGHEFSNPTCPRCGARPTRLSTVDREEILVDERVHEHTANTSGVSDPDATLDTMIEAASRPTLATLLKRGIETGAIKPTQEYSAGNTPN